MIDMRFPLSRIAALGLFAISGMTASAQFPPPRLPGTPSPKVPQPNLPKIPQPKIPTPNPSDLIKEAKKQAARIEDLRRQAEKEIKKFERMKDEFEKAKNEFDRLSKLAQSSDLNLQKEAYRTLTTSGVLKSNRDDVVKGIKQGLSEVVWGKEFDLIEQKKLATALGTSIATANPGPALLYINQFAVATKAEVMRNLRNASARAQQKVQDEFEMLLIKGLNALVKGQRPPNFGIDGMDLSVALATYNNWVVVRLDQPRLVPTEKISGVQLYRIATDPKTINVPLPNTFQPYFKLALRVR